ncbi:hypothetical protein ccbrp13_48110 [Ktedonobacteria bacterium brp13]|nr:hypothetical protein ccbrp13_48110 [Ktedonobacteria bacterium brp13]
MSCKRVRRANKDAALLTVFLHNRWEEIGKRIERLSPYCACLDRYLRTIITHKTEGLQAALYGDMRVMKARRGTCGSDTVRGGSQIIQMSVFFT